MDVVETSADAEGLTKPPLLVLDRVRAFLDEHGLGTGDVQARRIGEGGGSNFTFLLERDEGRFVLRRPPRPPLPPSAHGVGRGGRRARPPASARGPAPPPGARPGRRFRRRRTTSSVRLGSSSRCAKQGS